MHFTSLDQILDKANSIKNPKRVAVPGGDEGHALEAVIRAYKEGIAVPYLIGDENKIFESLERYNAEELRKYAVAAADDKAAAQTAVDLANDGKADLILKGGVQTADYLRPVVKGLKKRETLSVASFCTVPSYHKMFMSSDSALNVCPTLEQKRDIILNCVEALRAIGHDEAIKVAVLAAAEIVNPKIQASVDAAELKAMNQRGEIPDCIVEGPISFDLAFIKEAAEAKHYESPVAGDADIMIYPDLTGGNIAAKTQLWAGVRGIGFVVGAKVPVALPSRGSDSDAKYEMLKFCTVAAG